MSGESHKRRRGDDDNGGGAAANPPSSSAAPSVAAATDASATQAEKKVKIESAAAATSTGAPVTPAAAAAAAAGKKKRRWDTDGDGAASAAAAPAASSVAASSTPAQPASASAPSASAVALTPAQKALALQKSIAERLAAAKIPKVAPSASPAVSAAAVAAALASVTPAAVKQEGASSAAALSAAGLNPLQFLSPSVTVKDEKSWVPLRLDAAGRAVDAEGRVLQVERHTDLRINQKAKEDALAAAKAAQHKLPHAKIATTIIKSEGMSKFHDPRMPDSTQHPVERKPRGLVLVKPGKYIQQAATMRMKQLEKDLKDAAKAESKASTAAPAAPLAIEIVKPAAIPSVEWWDAKLLRDPLGSGYASEPNLDRVGSYIYHPIEVSSLVPAAAPPPMPVLLTKKERKKIKKRNKRELLKEKQDRVRLGLEAPAEPKMRIQNLMNVLLNDTVADPSAMEAKVRAQIAERSEAHESANAQAKLTSEQKAEKRRRKYAGEDLSAALSVCVYRAGELGDTAGGKARYQLSVNTEQWNLSGVAVLHPECNVVVVEGGPKAQRRFKRLMLHRIRWRRKQKNAMEKAAAEAGGEDGAGAEAAEEEEEESDSSDDEDDDAAAAGSSDNATTVSRTGACKLVWSGVVPKARFPPGRFVFEACRSEVLARNFLKAKGMESYWDMCRAIPANAKQQQVEL